MQLFRRRLVALASALPVLPFAPVNTAKAREIKIARGPLIALSLSANDTWAIMDRIDAREKARAEQADA